MSYLLDSNVNPLKLFIILVKIKDLFLIYRKWMTLPYIILLLFIVTSVASLFLSVCNSLHCPGVSPCISSAVRLLKWHHQPVGQLTTLVQIEIYRPLQGELRTDIH